uniref:type II toxin-antitoxin system RelE/ParE family toxin n=1 Tax=uncultured Caulobacter sp. TaxID=158749 RepID=UPI0025DAD366|nr:type II toxin-antitoxin system RelE/ParE family toxin [uncultured Caulobacter sp.]
MSSGYSIIYTPEAEAQLLALYHYLSIEASPATAVRFTDAIVERCEALRDFPERGAPRFGVRAGLRTLPFRRVTITYAVKVRQVVIVGIFYGGQDYESILGQDD